MQKINKHGLKRDLPADVALAVRKRCGFGCVVCGGALYDYEHFEPEFANAKEHDPKGIILLCPNHHRGKGSVISRSTIARAALNPHCLRAGFSHSEIDLDNCAINLGPSTVINCDVAIK